QLIRVYPAAKILPSPGRRFPSIRPISILPTRGVQWCCSLRRPGRGGGREWSSYRNSTPWSRRNEHSRGSAVQRHTPATLDDLPTSTFLRIGCPQAWIVLP